MYTATSTHTAGCAAATAKPTAMIDDLIVRLSERSATCIVVTHNLPRAFRVATRMAMLYDGAILEEGTPDQFRSSKNPIVRQFIDGNPSGPLSQRAAS